MWTWFCDWKKKRKFSESSGTDDNDVMMTSRGDKTKETDNKKAGKESRDQLSDNMKTMEATSQKSTEQKVADDR